MAQAFSRDPRDDARIIGFLDDVERSLVIELMHQTSVLLSDGVDADDGRAGEADATGSREPGMSPEDELFASLAHSMRDREAPTDPALRRLLPDGVANDDDAAREFRRLTEASLRDRKLNNLDVSMQALERGFIDDEQSAAIADDVYDRAADPGARGAGAHETGGEDEDAEPGPIESSTQRHAPTPDGLDDGSREISLSEAEARSMMMALTDVRLVLAERLGVRTDEDAEALAAQVEGLRASESAEQLLAAYYDFLTWMAESITLAVMRAS